MWHCGWLSREEWTAQYFTDTSAFGGAWEMPDGTACDQCPGYLAQLPQVQEAEAVVWALRKGVLAIYHPDASAVLLEAARLLEASYSQVEAQRLAKPTT
jgi:hypothetical protein